MRSFNWFAAEDCCCSEVCIMVSEIKKKYAFADDFGRSDQEYTIIPAESETTCRCPYFNRTFNFIPENSSDCGPGRTSTGTSGLTSAAFIEHHFDCVPIDRLDK